MTRKLTNPRFRQARNDMHRQLAGLAIASLLVAWLALPVAALADPPPWAPAHGHRAKAYRYVYYPSHEVYFAPATRHWFWLDGGRWRVGTSLPGGMVLASVPGVSIVLGTERPYEMNAYVVERYGGWRTRHHRHGQWRHHDDD